jgi:hypothetical protein
VNVKNEGRGANVVSLDNKRGEEQAKQERVRVFNGGAPEQFVTAAVLAGVLGFSRDWVYEHKRELGGIPSGLGPKPRWRFPLNEALRRMSAWGDTRGSEQAETRTIERKPRRRTRANEGATVHLLPIKGRNTAYAS